MTDPIPATSINNSLQGEPQIKQKPTNPTPSHFNEFIPNPLRFLLPRYPPRLPLLAQLHHPLYSSKMSSVSVFLLSISFLLLPFASAARFACTAKYPATCQSLVGYVPVNATTLGAVRSLFQLRSFRSLLAANSLPLNTPQNYTVPASSTVRVRFPCSCSGGSGSSFGLPVYKVRPGDGLDAIARGVFAGLVTYEEIAKANNISDPNRVEVGQQIKVCSFETSKF